MDVIHLFAVVFQVINLYECSVVLPDFLPSVTNLTFRVGELAKIPCYISNLGEKTVAWRKFTESSPLTINSMTYTRDNRYTVDHLMRTPNISEWNLLIKNVQEKDAGRYECQITTAEGLTLHVDVTVKAIIIGGSQYVVKGRELVLYCNITTLQSSVSSVDWFKDGKIILTENDDRYEIKTYKVIRDNTLYSQLKVHNVRSFESGIYTCDWANRTSDEMDVYVMTGSSAYHEGTGRSHRHRPNTAASIEARHLLVLLHLLTVLLLLS